MKFWGPRAALGLAVAASVFLLDQTVKYWLVNIFDLSTRQPLVLTSFLDFILLYNRGVSYSLVKTDQQWVLLLISLIISAVLWSWLCRISRKLPVVGLGLIIGGALGNALDRATYGAVVDYAHFFWRDFHWYVFNVADVAIVVGVVLMIYDGFRKPKDQGLGKA